MEEVGARIGRRGSRSSHSRVLIVAVDGRETWRQAAAIGRALGDGQTTGSLRTLGSGLLVLLLLVVMVVVNLLLHRTLLDVV